MRRIQGVTLIEMVVTLSVLGILAALAAPMMGDFVDKHRLVRQLRAVSDLAELARSEAMKRSGPSGAGPELKAVTMTINPGTGANWFVGLSHGPDGCAASSASCVLNQAGTNVPQRVTGADGGSITMTQPSGAAVLLRFDFRGLVTGTASATTVTLQSPRGKRLQLQISPIGMLTVCSPGGEVSGYTPCAT